MVCRHNQQAQRQASDHQAFEAGTKQQSSHHEEDPNCDGDFQDVDASQQDETQVSLCPLTQRLDNRAKPDPPNCLVVDFAQV
jgi:hypothetical protein